MQRRRFRAFLLGGFSFVAAAALAHGDTIHLKNGDVLKGKVVERPDGRLEIETKRGARIVEKDDVSSWDRDGAPTAGATGTDRIFLVDGRILVGDVGFSDDGKEVILHGKNGAESRFARETVKSIEFRQGKTPPVPAGAGVAPVSTEDEAEAKWRAQIDANIAKLRSWDTDAKDARKAREELLQLGVFAVAYVRAAIAAIDSSDLRVRPVLEEVLQVAEFKSVVPAKVEEAMPGVCEKLIDKDPDQRVRVINQLALTCPDDCATLLLHLIRTDSSAKVKSICVGQLSILKRYDELAQVLKMHEHGQWRLVAALELGEAGIYIGLPVLIEALKLDGPQFTDVRSLAIEKLKGWTHQGNLGYLPQSDDKEERDRAVARWETWWKNEGEGWAVKNSKNENSVSDEDKTKALDRWRDGNKVLAELQRKIEAAAGAATKVDPRDASYAYETAAYLFKQAYDLDPTLASARLSRAILLYEQLARPREAEGELKLLLARFAPENAKYLRALANAHLARIAEMESSWPHAERFWKEVRVLEPENLDAYVGIGDSFLERALAITGTPAPVKADGEGKPNPPSKEELDARKQHLDRAIAAYKDALEAIERKQRALRDSASELGGTTGEPEDHQTGRLLVRIREDRDTLVKRAAGIYFQIGRAESARGDPKEALSAFKAARSLDPKDERFVKAAALWEKLAGETPAPPGSEKP